MASSDASTRIQEPYFEYADNKNGISNDKNVTSDFIKLETSQSKSNLEFTAQKSSTVEHPYTEDLKAENDNKEDISDSLQDKFQISDDTNSTNSQNEDSGLEQNITDNKSVKISLPKEPDFSIDDNLPSTVTKLKTPDGSICYLIGTTHFSIESQNDVSKIIQAIQPHIIMVELCQGRTHILELDEETILEEAKNFNFSKIMDSLRKQGVYNGLFYVLLLNLSAHFTKVFGLAPGGEFRRALKEAEKIPNCIVQMGDRPINITIARALGALSWWQTIKLGWKLLRERDDISKAGVENIRTADTIKSMLSDIAEHNPELAEVFIKERDIYLTHSLQLVCRTLCINGKPVPARVVGIVGMGHTIGIVENWGKVKSYQIHPILRIPPPSMSGRILKFTVKGSIVATVAYVAYKFIPISGAINILKSSVEGLLKVTQALGLEEGSSIPDTTSTGYKGEQLKSKQEFFLQGVRSGFQCKQLGKKQRKRGLIKRLSTFRLPRGQLRKGTDPDSQYSRLLEQPCKGEWLATDRNISSSLRAERSS